MIFDFAMDDWWTHISILAQKLRQSISTLREHQKDCLFNSFRHICAKISTKWGQIGAKLAHFWVISALLGGQFGPNLADFAKILPHFVDILAYICRTLLNRQSFWCSRSVDILCQSFWARGDLWVHQSFMAKSKINKKWVKYTIFWWKHEKFCNFTKLEILTYFQILKYKNSGIILVEMN